MTLSRRSFFRLAGASAAGTLLASPLKNLLARKAVGQSIQATGFGSLIPDPQGLLDLPAGFSYQAFSSMGDIMSDGNRVPGDHDGMAAFPGLEGNTILVRNHELSPDEVSKFGVAAADSQKYDPLCLGGTTTLIVAPNGELLKDYSSLAGTCRNCAGGATPWGSWISCEEDISTPAGNHRFNPKNVSKKHGYNFEVPADSELVNPVPLVAMGRFYHEGIAVDPKTGIVYQTEDREDSLFYRFIPQEPGNLAAGGVLEALKIKDLPQAKTFANFPVGKPMVVEWVRIEDVDPEEDTVRREGFAKGAAQFTRGEGIIYRDNEVYFSCTNGGSKKYGQIWRYVPGGSAAEGGKLELFLESDDPLLLENPDNLTLSPFGDLIVCEDGGGKQFLVGVTPQGKLYHLAQNALNSSEFAGVCFSPDGRILFVNIQYPGITFAIQGPWSNKQ